MMPQWLPSDPDKGRPTKQKKKKMSRLGDFSGRLNSTSSNEMYMQINLQDLEAYTNQILEAERAKRRSVLCRVGVVLLWVGLVVTGGYTWKNQGALLGNNNTATTTDKELFVDWITDETYQDYPLTTCERKLGHNTSFHDLVKHFRVNSEMAKQWHCRPEFPDCDWINPTIPEPRKSNNKATRDAWTNAFVQNQNLVSTAEENEKEYDVVLLGGSLVEHMAGKELGQQKPYLKRDQDVFETLFTKQGGGSIEGLALGIGGDRCSHLLYRLRNGELIHPTFRPKVWWIVIGTQDWQLGVASESVVAGIISIVQSIRQIHPDAIVVINSLLPHDQSSHSIEEINRLLGCYVKSQSLIDEDKMRQVERRQNSTTPHHHKRLLHFFNATNLFMEKGNDGSYKVNPTYVLPGREDVPDPHGEWLWGKKIVETVEQLLQADGRRSLRQQQLPWLL